MPDKNAADATRPANVIRTALLVGLLAVLALVAWQLSHVLLLSFAAVLFAIILRSLAGLFEEYTPLKSPWSLVLSGFLITATAMAFMYLLGAQVQSQMMNLIERLPELITSLGNQLGIEDFRERLENQASEISGSNLVGSIAGYTSGLIAALANFIVVAIAGIYLAANPSRYRHGLLLLVPKRRRPEVACALDNTGRALRLWLLGRLIAMALVGTLLVAGLYMIGVPSALALGLLAGFLEFVPLVGPPLSAIPAILIALSEGGSMVYWVIGLYLVVQQIEGNVITPIIQSKAVDLPPAITLFAILALGILLGPLGIILGTPISVVIYVAVRQLYVRDALGEKVDIPGETK